jgi:hypothetical protein
MTRKLDYTLDFTGNAVQRWRSRTRIFSALLWYLFFTMSTPQGVHAGNVPLQTGDVLVGVQPGTIRHFSPQGVLLDTLSTGGSSSSTGMAFNASGTLFATAFDAQAVFQFDTKGNLLGAFGSGFNADTESIVTATEMHTLARPTDHIRS